MQNDHVIEAQIEKDRERLINTVVESIQIPSIKGPSVHGKSFGESVNAVFQHALTIASNPGFEVGNLDGYVGCAEYSKGVVKAGRRHPTTCVILRRFTCLIA